MISAFHGDERGAEDAFLRRPLEVDRAVVDEDVDVELDAARALVVAAVEVVVREADLVEPFGRHPRGRSYARWLVMWIQWPRSRQCLTVATASSYGSAFRMLWSA